MTPCATKPVGANGDNVPANAPLPVMIAMSSGGMPARAATAIAGGASSALAGVAPAPIVAIAKPIKKNMMGSKPACPRHRRTARSVNRASVPLTSAIERHRSPTMTVEPEARIVGPARRMASAIASCLSSCRRSSSR